MQTNLIQSDLNWLACSYASIFMNLHWCPSKHLMFIFSTDIDDCSPPPCQNGAACFDLVNDFQCNCAAGYEGNLCQTGRCLLQPHLLVWSCKSARMLRIICVVHVFVLRQYLGLHYLICKIELNFCDSSPCLHHGTCSSDVSGYTCSCDRNYVGTRCESGSLYLQNLYFF